MGREQLHNIVVNAMVPSDRLQEEEKNKRYLRFRLYLFNATMPLVTNAN